MDDKRRELILRVIDGDPRVVDVMYQMDRFVHIDRMLEFLVKNRITGKAFFDMYLNDFKASWLTFGKWIVMKVNGDNEMKAIIAGKDYRI